MLQFRRTAIFFFVLLMCAASKALCITIYISPAGNDSNAGTKEKPLASIKGARDKIRVLRKEGKQEDIQVIIGTGDYFMKETVLFTSEDGGTSTNYVSYVAEKGATPVFYGGVEIRGFEKVNDHLWRAFIPEVKRYGWNFEQLYVNNNRALRAQFPNMNFYQPRAITETIIDKGDGRRNDFALQKISLYKEESALLDGLSPSDLENAVITFYHKWDNTRKKIIHYVSKDTAFYIMGEGMKPWNKMDDKTLFTIENVKAGLDAPGEWYLESSGYLYYVPKQDELLTSVKCYAPMLDKFLVIEGTKDKKVENLRFENISFRVSGYTMPATGNEPMQAAASIEASVMVDFATKIRFINCEIGHTGTNAIWFRKACSYSTVEHCYLHDLGAGGVKIGEINLSGDTENSHHIIVNNNIIRNGGYVFPCAVALVIFTGSDNELTHNEVADFKYSAVSVGWVWGYGESSAKRNKIDFNHLHHLGWGVLSDMGGVYTLGPSEGTSVSNNVIHHVYSNSYGGWGLYTDEGSTGIVMENNLVYACKSSAFHQHYGKDNTIRNNIFYSQLRAQVEATRVEPHIGFKFTNNIIYYSTGNLAGIRWDQCNFLSDFNAYWDTRTREIMVAKLTFKQWQEKGRDVHSIIADPGFTDAPHLDFSIKNKSLVSKIKFSPFDYTKAGVYGDQHWKELAQFDTNMAKQFDEMVLAKESK